MRRSWALFFCVLCLPAVARAQSSPAVSVQFAGGPTLYDDGYSVAGGIGLSPNSRVTLLLDVSHTNIFTRTSFEHGVTSSFRGGTLTTVAGELRASLFPQDRVTPYAFIGVGAGRSRPNVNEVFPHPGNNADMRVAFAGGGIKAPIGSRLSVFADARMMIGAGMEADSFMAALPIRAGLAWRF